MNHRELAFVMILVWCPSLAARAEDFSGFIVDTGGAMPRRSSNLFTLHVDEYTTVEEAQAMANLLLSQGTEAVLEELRKLDKGYIKIGARLGYPVGLVRSIDSDDGGRSIRAVTDRPIQMFELMNDTRSSKHEFGVIEIQLDATGKGQGQLIAAAKVSLTKEGAVEIESLGTRPFTLNNIKTRAKKEKEAKAGS